MDFQSPWLLVGLLLVPIAIIAYVRHARGEVAMTVFVSANGSGHVCVTPITDPDNGARIRGTLT